MPTISKSASFFISLNNWYISAPKTHFIAFLLPIKLLSRLYRNDISVFSPSKMKRCNSLFDIKSVCFVDFLYVVSLPKFFVGTFNQRKYLSVVHKEQTIGSHQVVVHYGGVVSCYNEL